MTFIDVFTHSERNEYNKGIDYSCYIRIYVHMCITYIHGYLKTEKSRMLSSDDFKYISDLCVSVSLISHFLPAYLSLRLSVRL